MTDEEFSIRRLLSSEQRAFDMRLSVDPGFVNYRLVDAVLGQEWTDAINSRIQRIPDGVPAGLRVGQIDNIYARAVVEWCSKLPAPGLAELVAARKGRIFGSLLSIEATPEVYSDTPVQVRSRLISRASTLLTSSCTIRPNTSTQTRRAFSSTRVRCTRSSPSLRASRTTP